MSHIFTTKFKFTALDGGGVLLDLANGEYWQLNELGALLVSRISNGEATAEIINDLVATYPDSEQRIAADVNQLVAELQKMGAISHE